MVLRTRGISPVSTVWTPAAIHLPSTIDRRSKHDEFDNSHESKRREEKGRSLPLPPIPRLYLNSERFDVIRSVGTSSEIREIELNLIPAIVQAHGHGTDEWFDTCRRLIVAGTETTSNISIVQNLQGEWQLVKENEKWPAFRLLLELRRWNTSSSFWWSSQEMGVWCRESSSDRLDMLCRWY